MSDQTVNIYIFFFVRVGDKVFCFILLYIHLSAYDWLETILATSSEKVPSNMCKIC